MPATSRRLPRPDARLIIGVLLVIASVVGVVAVVAGANRTVQVYAASGAIASGEVLTDDRLALVEVHANDAVGYYLTPETKPEGELIATRPIGAGEYIPRSAIGAADESFATVVVPISGSVPAGIGPGVAVTLWSSVPGEQPGTFTTPQALVQQAEVVRIVERDQVIATGEVELELRVPANQVASVLGDATNGARMHVVPLHTTPVVPETGE